MKGKKNSQTNFCLFEQNLHYLSKKKKRRKKTKGKESNRR